MKQKNNDTASAISNAEIVAALINSTTISEAAASLNITARTIYNRMQSDQFKAMYYAAKTDLLRTAVNNMRSALSEAINTIRAVMNDKDASPGTRLQAAGMVLRHAGDVMKKFESKEDVTTNLFRFYGLDD